MKTIHLLSLVLFQLFAVVLQADVDVQVNFDDSSLRATEPSSNQGIFQKILKENVGGKNTIKGTYERLQLIENRNIILEENLAILSDVRSLAVINDNEFVLASYTVAELMLYDEKGKQKQRIGRWGNGPFEYGKPKIVKYVDDNLIVWDADNLKYIFYDREGKRIKEITGMKYAVDDFVYDGRYIISYSSRLYSEGIISIYDVEKKEEQLVGLADIENSILDLLFGGRYMALQGNILYYTTLDKDIVRMYDIETGEESTVRIDDDDFNVEPSGYNSIPEVQKDFSNGKVHHYLANNSRALGILKLEDYFVAVLENGILQTKIDERIPVSKQRSLKLVVFDHRMNYLDSIILEHAYMNKIGQYIRGVNKNNLYFVREVSNDDGSSLERTLFELTITP